MDTRGTTPLGDSRAAGDPARSEGRVASGRRWAADDPVEPVGACPDAETLAAFVDGRLDPAQRAQVAAHVTTCDDCLFVVGETGRFLDADEEAAGPVVLPFWRRRRLLLTAGGVLATAAVLVLAVRLPTARGGDYARDVRALYDTIGDQRPVSARLTNQPFGAAPTATRSATPVRRVPGAATLDAAAGIEARARSDATPDARWALGVARLVNGDYDGAVAALEAAAADRPREARLAVDLSAALLARAEWASDTASAERALAEADRALGLAPASREAQFNRALALHYLDRRPEAAEAWRAYLAADPSSPWAAEIRDRYLP